MRNKGLLLAFGAVTVLLLGLFAICYLGQKDKSIENGQLTGVDENGFHQNPTLTPQSNASIANVTVEDGAKESTVTFHGQQVVENVVFVIEYTHAGTEIYSANLVCDEFNRTYIADEAELGRVVFHVDSMHIADYVATISYDNTKQLGTIVAFAMTEEDYENYINPEPIPKGIEDI